MTSISAAVASCVFFFAGCATPTNSKSDEHAQKVAAELTRADDQGDGDHDGDHDGGATSRKIHDEKLLHVSRIAPVLLNDISRNPPLFEDFLRFAFISDPTSIPVSLARPRPQGPLRTFMTASFLFAPPLPVEEAVEYVGLADVPTQNFAAFRCRPKTPEQKTALEPVLASWPNVFQLLQEDFGAQASCPAGPEATPETQLVCLARQFVDTPTPLISVAIANALDIGAQMIADPTLQATLQSDYSIFKAFSGLGYAVKNSANDVPLTAEEAIRNLIASEYLVINVFLREGNCRCILVPPYPGRSQAPVDPDFVWKEGGSDQCRKVPRLKSRRAGLTRKQGELADLTSPEEP